MRLHVGGICSKDGFDTVNGELLRHVDVFATTVIALAWVTLSIFISQLRALGLHDGGRGIVFAGDELNMVFLSCVFCLNGGPYLWICVLNQDIAVVHVKVSLEK